MIELKRRKLIAGTISFLLYANCNKLIAKITESEKNIKFSDVNALRNSQQIDKSAIVFLHEYFQGSGKGGGTFTVDTTDTATQDDGGYCFVNQSQQRLKRICQNNRIAASSFGIDGCPADNTDAFKNFMKVHLDKVIDVDIYTKGVAQVADNTNIIGTDTCTIYATDDVCHDNSRMKNNQGQTLEVGNNCHITNVRINGRGFKNNGFLVNNKKNVVIKNCQVKNGKGQALLEILSQDCVYDGNTFYDSHHGIQLWLSKGTVVSNNIIFQVTGGIWSACAVNVSVTSNYVHDCSDVGIDWEGGNKCIADNNRVERCANGELAVFSTGRKLLKYNIPMGDIYYKNNTVVRGGGYLTRNGIQAINSLGDTGACMIYGNLDKHLSGPIVFEGNVINIGKSNDNSVRCFSSRGSSNSDAKIIFKNNKFTSYASHVGQLNNLNDVEFTGNDFIYVADEFKLVATIFDSVRNLTFSSNTITVTNHQADNSPWMKIHWIGRGNKLSIINNTFTGFSNYPFVINDQDDISSVIIKGNVFKGNELKGEL